jgi:hypothetical protein
LENSGDRDRNTGKKGGNSTSSAESSRHSCVTTLTIAKPKAVLQTAREEAVAHCPIEKLFQIVLYKVVGIPVKIAFANFALDKFVSFVFILSSHPEEFIRHHHLCKSDRRADAHPA